MGPARDRRWLLWGILIALVTVVSGARLVESNVNAMLGRRGLPVQSFDAGIGPGTTVRLRAFGAEIRFDPAAPARSILRWWRSRAGG